MQPGLQPFLQLVQSVKHSDIEKSWKEAKKQKYGYNWTNSHGSISMKPWMVFITWHNCIFPKPIADACVFIRCKQIQAESYSQIKQLKWVCLQSLVKPRADKTNMMGKLVIKRTWEMWCSWPGRRQILMSLSLSSNYLSIWLYTTSNRLTQNYMLKLHMNLINKYPSLI